jgi:hypothetical protein
MRPVEVLQHAPKPSRKVRIRWLDGEYDGLDQWVPGSRLLVEWHEREAFLSDEVRLAAVLEASEGVRFLDARWQAVMYAFYSAPDTEFVHGDDGSGCQGLGHSRDAQGTFEIDLFDHRETWFGRTKSDLLDESLAFVDRFGTYYAPFAVAEKAARWICERYADDVLETVGKEEAELRDEAVRGRVVDGKRGRDDYVIPRENCAEYLRKKEPIYAVVREWCGGVSSDRWNELEALREHNARLRTLVSETASFLRRNRHFAKAGELRRAINEPEPIAPDPPEPKREPVEKSAFTPPEVAAFLGVTPQRVRRAIAAGQLYGVKLHRYTLVPKRALEAFLDGRPYGPDSAESS